MNGSWTQEKNTEALRLRSIMHEWFGDKNFLVLFISGGFSWFGAQDDTSMLWYTDILLASGRFQQGQESY